MNMLDPRFAPHVRRYLSQVALATAALLLIFAFQDTVTGAAVVTALASTTFLLFVNPSAKMAEPRRILGGHALAVVVALAFSQAPGMSHYADAASATLIRDAIAAAAVGAAMLLMAMTNTEHAPAAGTVLGLVIGPWSTRTAVTVIIVAAALAIVRARFRQNLIDLV